MKPTVLFERQDALAIVTLSNPGKMNALNLSMWQDLGDVMNQLSADPSVRCVILRGEGEQAFAAAPMSASSPAYAPTAPKPAAMPKSPRRPCAPLPNASTR
jgi:enoyl-CoA hydratase